MRLILIFLLLGALFTGLPTPGGAQTTEGAAETPALMLERWDAESGRIEQRLAEDPPQAAEIDEMRGLLDAQRNAIPDLITTAKAGLEPLRQQLQALGEPPEDPATETVLNTDCWVECETVVPMAMAMPPPQSRAIGAPSASTAAPPPSTTLPSVMEAKPPVVPWISSEVPTSP